MLIGSGSLVCLMPLALYLLFLSYLNQRERPTIMSGPWDFACVLLGLSGFFLVGGPLILSVFDSNLRGNLFSGNFQQMRNAWDANSRIWSLLAASYFALLISCIALVMLLRRSVTIVYNVDTVALEGLVGQTLDAIGIPWKRTIGGIEIGGRVQSARPILDDDTPAPSPLKFAGRSAFLRIDAFPSVHHATLRWREAEPLLRCEIENGLEKTFAQIESPPNSVGGWFMTASIALFFVMLAWMGFIIYWIIRQPKAL